MSLNDLFGDKFTVGMEKKAGDSLLKFWNNMEQATVCLTVRQHPLPRASHEATDRPIKVLPVTRQQPIRAQKKSPQNLAFSVVFTVFLSFYESKYRKTSRNLPEHNKRND